MFIVILIVVIAVLVGPSAWVSHVMRKYRRPSDRYQDRGTGAELARHLLDRFDLQGIKVETTDSGDHYDPNETAVRLSNENFNGYSLTAITVAAHEVGHAIQHRNRERFFMWRYRLASFAVFVERIGAGFFLVAPIVAGITRSPVVGVLFLGMAVATVLMTTVIHLITLPVEFDASFNKAMVILDDGRYLKANDAHHARRILRAAALTYVSGSLFSLLNVWRWLRVLRR